MIQAKQRQLISIELQKLKRSIRSFSHWFIFPFQINSGAIGNNETGYKPLNAKVTDYGSYELIFTGDSPVICLWQGSTIIYQKNKGITDPNTGITTGQDQFYTKQYNLEKSQKWKSYIIEDISNVNFGNLNSNTVFSTLSIGRTYTLISFDEQIKVNNYLQFFVVLNDNDNNIAGGTTNEQDRQLLYLSNVTNKYDPYTNKFFCQVITLSSVNDRASSSGLTVQSFIQYGGAGSGYAFPQFIEKKLQFNKELMRDIGVRYAHRQSYGLELLTSCYYYGRPIIQGQEPIKQGNEEIYEQKVFSSRRLIIAGNNEFSTTEIKSNGGLLAGINDQITTSSHPETTFYNLMDARPTGYTNYDTWQKFLEARNFDMLAQKDFKGLLTANKELATKSNGTSIGEAKMFWDSEWNINNLQGEYNVDMSSNFKYKDPDTGLIIGSPTVDYSKITQKYMSAILNFNSVVFSSLVQMPYDSNQWLPFALSNIPLIGKMLNALSLGIPVGFIITQNSQQYKKMPFFNGFMSAFFASNLSSIIGNDNDNWFIPLNVFSNTGDFAIGKMLGANVSTTAMTMKLSDRISVYPWDAKTGQKLPVKEQISTVDLSQKKTKEIFNHIVDDKVYIMAEDTEFLDISSPLTNEDKETQWNPTPNGTADGQNYGYIIDYIVTQSLHQGEERHTFYSDNPFTYQRDYNEISIAQYRYKNMGSFTGNSFNWLTQYKTNHDEYSETEETTFSYPASILPPNALNLAKSITINTDLKVELNYKDIPLVTTPSNSIDDNTQEWFNNNSPVSNNINIDIKSLLDPTLLINTFNDLQRFYKSITIYYSYYVGSVMGSNGYRAKETFNPAKELTSSIEINLNNLIFSSKIPNIDKIVHFEKGKINDRQSGYAYAYFQGNKSQYNLLTYEFIVNTGREAKINNNNPIGFDIISNSNDNLNWKINIFVTPCKTHVESIVDFGANSYAQIYTNQENAIISKIVLNAR